MTRRITASDCNKLAEHICQLTGNPTEPYVRGDGNRYHAQVGCFFISRSLASYTFVRMVNESGAERPIISASNARELYDRMHAWLDGYYFAREGK